MELMGKKWGCTPAVQAALDNFQGEKVDSCFLRAVQLYWGYGVDENREEAFRMFSEGVKLGDPSGRCHWWLGTCHHFGYGTEKNLDKAIQMYRAGVALADPRSQCLLGLCYKYGAGVPEDIDEARRLYTLSHRQGYVYATYRLGLMSPDSIPLQVALYKEASARGLEDATDELQGMQREDPSSVVPFGCWSPHRHVHRWDSDLMHREMMCLLMARRRPDGLVSTLPKLALMRICFFVACRPEEYTAPSAEGMLLARQERTNWDVQRNQSLIIKMQIESLGERVDRRMSTGEITLASLQQQISSLQQQMQQQMQHISSVLQLLTTVQHQTQTDDQPSKRQKH